MTITSNLFIAFVALVFAVYYIVPKKGRWLVLLFASYAFYMYASVSAVVFILVSTLSTYACARWVEVLQKRGKTGKSALVLALVLNLGILGVLKYSAFVMENVNALFHTELTVFRFLLPLGISYYTFQSLGYMLDVYWKRISAERNLGKYALFLVFFPQLVQGPIGRYQRLANQLYEGHDWSFHNLKFGLERILWGLFKKMVLADWAAIYCDAIFADPKAYAGANAFGVLLYTVELYGNFAGGIDVMLGVATLFGIELDENFKRPFFATSLTDFWHRWHITLGTWMKDYVFYPLTLSGGMMKLGKVSKKAFGKKIGRNIPVCLSNLLVFTLVGIWHGPTWNNIGWGLFNGMIIAASGLLAGAYASWKKKLHINDKSKGYHLFMIVRTFVLMNISWYFDCVDSVKTAWYMIVNSVVNFHPSTLLTISSGKLGTAFTPYALAILVVGCLIWFLVSFLEERNICLREKLSKLPFYVQFLAFTCLFLCIGLLSPMAVARGFIYAQF
ncbi:MAG: MBOAT family O-acyltransferase [Wujia sp.]